MALSRLLHIRPGLYFHGRGIPIPSRWFSFSPSPSGGAQKLPSAATVEDEAANMESNVKKCIEREAILKNSALVKNKAGGSWHALTDLFCNLKEKIIGSGDFKDQICRLRDSVPHGTEVKIVPPQNSQHFTELDEVCRKESVSVIAVPSHSSTSDGSSSPVVFSSEVSNPVETNNCAHTTELVENEGWVLSSEAKTWTLNDDKNVSTTVSLQLEKNSNALIDSVPVTSQDTSSSNLEPRNEQSQFEGVNETNPAKTERIRLGNRTKMDVIKQHAGFNPKAMSSNCTKKVVRLTDLFNMTMNDDQSAREFPNEKNILMSNAGFLEASERASGEGTAANSAIKCLIKCIRELPVLPREQCVKTSEENTLWSDMDNRATVKLIPSHCETGPSVKETVTKEKPKSLKGLDMESKCNGVSNSAKQSNSIVHKESKPLVKDGEIKLSSKASCKDSTALDLEEESEDNKVLLRFLSRDVENCDIFISFRDCGPIVKIQELPPVEGALFKDAYVHFKTKSGMMKAIKKTDLMMRNRDAIVESASSQNLPRKISIPSLIGDPSAPVSLLKNPTRTVVIRQLTDDISLRHLKEALSFCGSAISSFYMGSSSSVAYVEFETEDAKEKAIELRSVKVLGSELLIFRIDSPRTTVVRISKINKMNNLKRLSKGMKSINSICNSSGQVKFVVARSNYIVDVHFKLAEWPNMLNILNSLNGKEVDGEIWIAKPAPYFPPDILQVLWSEPHERQHVRSVLSSLLKRLDHPADSTKLIPLVAEYFGVENL